jgi:uncharacterized Zn finger protein (UPF0148 family)
MKCPLCKTTKLEDYTQKGAWCPQCDRWVQIDRSQIKKYDESKDFDYKEKEYDYKETEEDML